MKNMKMHCCERISFCTSESA